MEGNVADDLTDDERALFGQLEEPDVSDVVNMTALSPTELLDLLADTREKLFEMGEMMSDLENEFGTPPGSPEARALHSTRLACLAEMSRRGMR